MWSPICILSYLQILDTWLWACFFQPHSIVSEGYTGLSSALPSGSLPPDRGKEARKINKSNQVHEYLTNWNTFLPYFLVSVSRGPGQSLPHRYLLLQDVSPSCVWCSGDHTCPIHEEVACTTWTLVGEVQCGPDPSVHPSVRDWVFPSLGILPVGNWMEPRGLNLHR